MPCQRHLSTIDLDITMNISALSTEGAPESPDWERPDRAMTRLSEAHREILRLKYYGGLSYDEMADVLGIPKGTVMSRLHLARKGLARELTEEPL